MPVIEQKIKLAEDKHKEREARLVDNFQETVSILSDNLNKDKEKSVEQAVSEILG